MSQCWLKVRTPSASLAQHQRLVFAAMVRDSRFERGECFERGERFERGARFWRGGNFGRVERYTLVPLLYSGANAALASVRALVLAVLNYRQ